MSYKKLGYEVHQKSLAKRKEPSPVPWEQEATGLRVSDTNTPMAQTTQLPALEQLLPHSSMPTEISQNPEKCFKNTSLKPSLNCPVRNMLQHSSRVGQAQRGSRWCVTVSAQKGAAETGRGG